MNRIRFAFFGLLVFSGLVLVRLFYWQVVKADELGVAATRQHLSLSQIPAQRGQILASDDFPLVSNQEAFLVFADLPEIKEDKEAAGKTLFTAIKAIDSLKILFAPVLPFSCEQLHQTLGYDKPLFGEQYTQSVEDNLGVHEVLRYREGEVCCEWGLSELKPGSPFNQPQPLFKKLDPEVADEEYARLG